VSAYLDMLNDGLSYHEVGKRANNTIAHCKLKGFPLLRFVMNSRRRQVGWKTMDLAKQVNTPWPVMRYAIKCGELAGLMELRTDEDGEKRWWWVS
jgi:hypothetical protein